MGCRSSFAAICSGDRQGTASMNPSAARTQPPDLPGSIAMIMNQTYDGVAIGLFHLPHPANWRKTLLLEQFVWRSYRMRGATPVRGSLDLSWSSLALARLGSGLLFRCIASSSSMIRGFLPPTILGPKDFIVFRATAFRGT